MMQVISRSPANPRPLGLEPTRIAAAAGAIAVNIVVLMLMMVPIQFEPPPERLITLPDVEWLPRERPVPVVPVPVPVEPPREQVRVPEPTPAVVPRSVPEPAVVLPEPAGLPVAPTVEPAARAPALPTGTPSLSPVLEGVSLQYEVAPPPPYPRRALRDGAQGTVLLQIRVDTDGRPLSVEISRSSGNRDLDRAALRHVEATWRFRPALVDGRPVQAVGLVPISFTLDR